MTPEIITLAMTGASGAEYTLRLFECCLQKNIRVQFITSQPGQIVLGMETELKLSGSPQKMRQKLADYFNADPALISVYSKDQWTAPPASGSSVADAMVVCPCSMGSLASIALGSSENLIHRAADVAIKERRTLILVPRETPFSSIHLDNMLKLSRLGVVILPPNPGFYHGVNSVSELVDFIVARMTCPRAGENEQALK
jgi:4-hydroxy-3-polyprenylbenzoate decarboxylase